MQRIVFFDTEIEPNTGKLLDIGAVKSSGEQLHSASRTEFAAFVRDCPFVCGHNVLRHDLRYVGQLIQSANGDAVVIDTLPLSPLLFPKRPYHRLVKDDKLQSDELNNPLSDSVKARNLFYDEVNAFSALPDALRAIYCNLLHDTAEFSGFFRYLKQTPAGDTEQLIRRAFHGKLCEHAALQRMLETVPVELAYTLALINVDDKSSITPPWVIRSYPRIDNVMRLLRGTPCEDGCAYCRGRLDVRRQLKSIFGFDGFRSYNGEPLQERAAAAAVAGQSLLAVFPTGGGKSVTFQLPALIAGETARALTVVISPLQSLMKDQVDNLEERGIADAVTINGLLDPIERKAAIDRVANGLASILYISPESLRSKTVEELLYQRNVARFVIDEAHCFSAWGQDFRVDYMYIGDFIRKLQDRKNLNHPIPVSCFTATAKQKVISDIRDYFHDRLGVELALFATGAARENLHYAVLYKENDDEKYLETRNLIEAKNCPTIVYVSRVKRTVALADRLRQDGFSALPYNGRMESTQKIANQNAFIQGKAQIIVATSAFGMGVDKKDVGLVIHFDISDSLENYVQEAGRAGRDASLDADCYVLFNDEDLDKHFILLNQTKLSLSEIQQVWRAVKEMTRRRAAVSCSALEIAREAGWDDSVGEIETRVTTAIAALEQAGYLERGRNVPRVYANSLLVSTMAEAAAKIDASPKFTPKQREQAKRSVKYMISRHSIAKASDDDAETRVDYIADRLGIPKEEVIDAVNLMREEDILADHTDLSAYVHRTETQNRSELALNRFLRLEDYLIDHLPEGDGINLKEVNDAAIREGVRGATVKNLRTLIFYWTIAGYLRKTYRPDDEHAYLARTTEPQLQRAQFERRAELARFIITYLFRKSEETKPDDADGEERIVQFSILELQTAFQEEASLLVAQRETTADEIQKTLLYLSKIHALTLDGGFLVSYNAMQLRRLELDNRIQYKREDYRQLDRFYQQRIQQIHIVGEYAHLMVKSYDEALQFVSDYFQMDYRMFLAKYFKGTRMEEINRNITTKKFDELFGVLSDKQRAIINDRDSKYIVVSAGPGSGKTKLLVHKLASLMMLEEVKHEQLLMLTFSRAAATEFKSRLMDLIGKAAKFVEIKTFHSYCFDLLGKIGSLEESENVVRDAAEMIARGEVEPGRITKTVLVIDEAQDMDAHEFALVRALMKRNTDMRVIAVGDDDQNIYAFRGSDAAHMKSLMSAYGAACYEMTDNYRSRQSIVALANAFAATLPGRMKHEPIRAVSPEPGTVHITSYRSHNLELPLVADRMAQPMEGTQCILTATNEEALRVTGL
ncbi:MAG: RecQ family ATP-dependent DNA helicase, partial [Oscillospiraceae bacterium]|nr:RecQ family ATP-dependent DNA helicase [Oscillospiraceae bacterium]